MERRDFLKLCSMTGLAVVAGTTASASTEAAELYDGPLHLFVHQGGGWDVTSVCDPKGSSEGETDPMNKYPVSAIEGQATQGNIRWAPMELSPDTQADPRAGANRAFFTKHANDLLVINGIDMMTNSHDVGTRAIWAGDLTEGKPTVAALIAAAFMPEGPMSFVSFGGYDVTGGVIAATRLGNVEAIKRLAFPYRRDPSDEASLYLTEATQSRIADARKARHEARIAKQRLPRVRESMSVLYLSRLGQNELKRLVGELDKIGGNLEQGLAGATQLVIAAYKAGLCVSANLSTGGWDTHGNNDTGVVNALNGLLGDPNRSGGEGDRHTGVTRMMELLEESDIRDNSVVYMGSDFGRTPGYNEGNGKDHWAVSSMMVMGSVRGRRIAGNRVVGATDERHNPLDVDTKTLEVGSGKRIKPGHVQNAIRRLAGIEEAEIVRNFPTTEDPGEFANLIELEG
jgi:hypothetical protein